MARQSTKFASRHHKSNLKRSNSNKPISSKHAKRMVRSQSQRHFLSKLKAMFNGGETAHNHTNTPKPTTSRTLIKTTISTAYADRITVPVLSSHPYIEEYPESFSPLQDNNINNDTTITTQSTPLKLKLPRNRPITTSTTTQPSTLTTLDMYDTRTIQHAQEPLLLSSSQNGLYHSDPNQYTSIDAYPPQRLSFGPMSCSSSQSPDGNNETGQNSPYASYFLPIMRVGPNTFALLQTQYITPNLPQLRLLGGNGIPHTSSITSASINSHYQTNGMLSASLDSLGSIYDLAKHNVVSEYREKYRDHQFYSDEQLALKLVPNAPIFLDFFITADHYDNGVKDLGVISGLEYEQKVIENHKKVENQTKVPRNTNVTTAPNDNNNSNNHVDVNINNGEDNITDNKLIENSNINLTHLKSHNARVKYSGGTSVSTTGRIIVSHLYQSEYPLDPPVDYKSLTNSRPLGSHDDSNNQKKKSDTKNDRETSSSWSRSTATPATPTPTKPSNNITIPQLSNQPHALHILDLGAIPALHRDSLDPSVVSPYINNALIYPKLFEDNFFLFNKTQSTHATKLASLLMASQTLYPSVQRYTELHLARQDFNNHEDNDTLSSLSTSLKNRSQSYLKRHTQPIHPAPFPATLQPWYSTMQTFLRLDQMNRANDLAPIQIDRFFRENYAVGSAVQLQKEYDELMTMIDHSPQLQTWFLPLLHHFRHPGHQNPGGIPHPSSSKNPLLYRSPVSLGVAGRGNNPTNTMKRQNNTPFGAKKEYLFYDNNNNSTSSQNNHTSNINDDNVSLLNSLISHSYDNNTIPYDVAPSLHWVPLVDLLHTDKELRPRLIRETATTTKTTSPSIIPSQNKSLNQDNDQTGSTSSSENPISQILQQHQQFEALRGKDSKGQGKSSNLPPPPPSTTNSHNPINSTKDGTSFTNSTNDNISTIDNIFAKLNAAQRFVTLKKHYWFLRPDLVSAAWNLDRFLNPQLNDGDVTEMGVTERSDKERKGMVLSAYAQEKEKEHGRRTNGTSSPLTSSSTINPPTHGLNHEDLMILKNSSPKTPQRSSPNQSKTSVQNATNNDNTDDNTTLSELGQLMTSSIGYTYPIRHSHHQLLTSSPQLKNYLVDIIQSNRTKNLNIIGESRFLQRSVQYPTMLRDMGYSMSEIAEIIENIPSEKLRDAKFFEVLGTNSPVYSIGTSLHDTSASHLPPFAPKSLDNDLHWAYNTINGGSSDEAVVRKQQEEGKWKHDFINTVVAEDRRRYHAGLPSLAGTGGYLQNNPYQSSSAQRY